MVTSRLDQITENYVTISTQKDVPTQTLYVLQDISTTLAMIYDKMCESEDEAYDREILERPAIIDERFIGGGRTCIYEEIGKIPVQVEVIDADKTFIHVRMADSVNVKLLRDSYGKSWRLWNCMPSKSDIAEAEWKK